MKKRFEQTTFKVLVDNQKKELYVCYENVYKNFKASITLHKKDYNKLIRKIFIKK